MENLINFLKGKKAYLIAIATAILGVLQALNVFILPEWAYVLLASAFGIALRAGVEKVAEAVKPPEG